MTRAPASATITPTAQLGPRVALDTTFLVGFSRPVDLETRPGRDPPRPADARHRPHRSPGSTGPTRFEFVPRPRSALTSTTGSSSPGVRDTDGLPLEQAAVAVRTTTAPSVVRFRPSRTARGSPADAVLSVRFTQTMDRPARPARSRSRSAGSRSPVPSTGPRHDTVLVFDPKAALPYGAKVSMDVAAGARNTEGLPLAKAAHAIFHTARRGVIPVVDTGRRRPDHAVAARSAAAAGPRSRPTTWA